MVDEPDELTAVRAAFYIGDYQRVSEEASIVPAGSPQQEERKNCYVYRALVAQLKFDELDSHLDQHSPVAYRVIRLLGKIFENPGDKHVADTVVSQIEELKINPEHRTNENFQIVASTIYLQCGNLSEALKLIFENESLEGYALKVQIFIQLHRLDFAEKEVAKMKEIDDDDALTALASSWLYIAKGGAKNGELAYRELQDVVDKFGNSIAILNAQGICQVMRSNFTESLGLFKEARELARTSPKMMTHQTMINYVTALQHARRPNVDNFQEKVLETLREQAPHHAYLANYDKMSAEFDKAAANFR